MPTAPHAVAVPRVPRSFTAATAAGSGDATGSEPATDLAALVVRHQGMIWRYLRLLGADAHEADDLMQETFLRVARMLRGGEEPAAPAAFLRGVARNLLIGVRRRDHRRPLTSQWFDAVEQFAAAEPLAFEDGRVEVLRQCVQRLRGRVRQAVEWHHLEGVPRDEVAARLGIGPHGLKSLLGRARDALRECVNRMERKEQV
ncbi:MAG: sigma-70 family RNA polymerase sigma factor [Planctomycetes bacterium]|nr:sigma-70 family RNA polymerase sigma factor [Planctomycetota bacterium]